MLTELIRRCASVSIVSGFATPDGLEVIKDALAPQYQKLDPLIVGAVTQKSLQAFRELQPPGSDGCRIWIHLGYSRDTKTGRHRFYRYHPMLHGKLYYFKMPDGTATAIIGSHNVTSFALSGMNGEIAVRLDGPAADEQFRRIESYVAECKRQAIPYDPKQKEAYVWWSSQFYDGLKRKTFDLLSDAEFRRTIIIIAASDKSLRLKPRTLLYFEMPSALRMQIRSADVHVYLLPNLPGSGSKAIPRLPAVGVAYKGYVVGFEQEGGAMKVRAGWEFDAERGLLSPTDSDETHTPSHPEGKQQIRAVILGRMYERYDYRFTSPAWKPEYAGSADDIVMPSAVADLVQPLQIKPPEDGTWQRVVALKPHRSYSPAVESALRVTGEDATYFLLFSFTRIRRQREKG
jgi:HKD family nuclease